jgi:serine/threonine protein kinase
VTGFFGELRRRGVLGALTAYAVAAAGSLQLADILRSNLDLPGWTVRALIWVAAAGFIATFLVSWFYDLTRHGFVRTQAPAERAPTPATPRKPTVPTPHPPEVPVELAPGALLAGRYRLERELGKGGMGRVLVARDEKLGRRVAVKVVTAAHDPARVRRFEQEARTAGALEHPHVLAVYDLGDQDGVPFLVTELLEGHTLRTVIDGPRLPYLQVQGLALQLARGLAAAHARGIVHRDLKPENLFLTDDGRLKILDFGLARLSSDDEQGPGLTVTGAIFGTPGYLSPEQARGEKAGPPSDVFSAGAILYEMLSGKRAFPGASLIESGHLTLNAQPAPLPPTVPAPLAALVTRCLEKQATRRFQNGAELARALDTLEPGAPVTLPPRPRSWKKPTWVAVGVALLAIAAAMASAMRAGRSAHEAIREQRRKGPIVLEYPKPPEVPPPPSSGGSHPKPPLPGTEIDGEQLARDLRKQIEKSMPRAGTLGLIAGARALEKTNRKERAEQVLKKSRDPIARLELFLLQRNAGREAEAQKELRAYAAAVEKDEWPAPLLRTYLGQARDAAALEAASGDDEECEANYYLGRFHARDDVAQARKYLEKATGEDCDQAEFAREDLAQLQSR